MVVRLLVVALVVVLEIVVEGVVSTGRVLVRVVVLKVVVVLEIVVEGVVSTGRVLVRVVVVLVEVRDEDTLTMGPGRPKQFVPEHLRSKKFRTVSVCVWMLWSTPVAFMA